MRGGVGLLLVLACAVGRAGAWWRPSGWSSPYRGDLSIAEPERCLARYSREVRAKQDLFRQRCMSVADVTAFGWLNIPMPANGQCYEACLRQTQAIPWEEPGRRLPSRIAFDTAGWLYRYAVLYTTVSNRRTGERYCSCGPLVKSSPAPSRFDPQSCRGIPAYEVPMTCMWTPQDVCEASPDDACRWVDGCCVDAKKENPLYRDVIDDGQQSGGANKKQLFSGLGAIVVVLVAIICVVCWWRRRHANDHPMLVYVRRRGRRGQRRSQQLTETEAKWMEDTAAVNGVVAAIHALEITEGHPGQGAAVAASPAASGIGEQCCVVCLGEDEPVEDEEDAGDPDAQAVEAAAARVYDDAAFCRARGWARLPCGHVMHAVCVRHWFIEQGRKRDTPSCPMCRTPPVHTEAKEADTPGGPAKTVGVEALGQTVHVSLYPDDTVRTFSMRVQAAVYAAGGGSNEPFEEHEVRVAIPLIGGAAARAGVATGAAPIGSRVYDKFDDGVVIPVDDLSQILSCEERAEQAVADAAHEQRVDVEAG